jgi:metal-dependent amidase/aminoacylase/carboxypeptidase family protein
MLPFVGQLPCGGRNGWSRGIAAQLATVKPVPSPNRFVVEESGGQLVRGSVHSASAAARTHAKQRVIAGLEDLRSAGVELKISYDERIAPGVTNDAGLAARANVAIGKVLGEGNVETVPPAPPVFSEDCGFFQDAVPGVFWFLGVSNPAKGTVGMPHNPSTWPMRARSWSRCGR